MPSIVLFGKALIMVAHGELTKEAGLQWRGVGRRLRIASMVLSALAVSFGYPTIAAAQEQPWSQFFAHQVATAEQATLADLEQASAENWPQLQRRWRRQLREMLGVDALFREERPDLHTSVTGTVELDTVLVDRLHYQSLPGLYVTANLYRPKGPAPETGWPAVLYVCGHAKVADYGRFLGNKTHYQHHGLWLARHGVVCLIIDTIGLGELHGQHHGTYHLGRWDWISRGYTPGGVEAWNAIRGIDLLCQREDIDTSRLGITGRSGGGAYSWFAAALDDRIRVAVPVAGITDLRNHVIDGCVEGHCDCMYFENYYGWDYGKLAALVAPRPLLLVNTDADRIFPLDGVLRIDAQLRRLYGALGASDRYGLVIAPGPHADTQSLRVPAFDWLLKHLGQPQEAIQPPAQKELDPRQLAVFEHETPRDERVTSLPGWFVTPADATDASSVWARCQEEWLPRLRRWHVLPRQIQPAAIRMAARGEAGAWKWTLWRATTDEGAGPRIAAFAPATIAETADPPSPAVVHLVLQLDQAWDGEDASRLLDHAGIAARLDARPAQSHYFVVWRGADWFARAGSVAARNQLVRRFYLLGSTPEMVASRDLAQCLAWLSEQNPKLSWRLVATGREVLPVGLAALMLQEHPSGESIQSLELGRVPRDPQLAAAIPGILRLAPIANWIDAVRAVVPVEHGDWPPLGPELLVDPSTNPQQANGLRIVEVAPDRATIWVRATMWPAPNLGDLPDVQFAAPGNKGRKNQQPILPELGTAGLRYAVPGVSAEARVGYRPSGGPAWTYTPWTPVDASSDFSCLFALDDLQPNTHYALRTQVRRVGGGEASSTLNADFRTLPIPDAPAEFRLAVGTCQGFPDRDGPFGFDVYRTMERRGTNAFVMAGDVVYYDRLARSPELAYYHWQRTYGLPTLVDFHRHVPTFFLKDDHDTYVNDSWPGEHFAWTESFTFEMGQRIFRQETGLPDPPYRTFHVGDDMQVWLMEGRDFRSPNSAPDGPAKSIWGAEQKAWLARTLEESTAAFKVIISPTPLVGPDRDNKHDNHANPDFATEGRQIRRLLASFPNTISVCGDRHWQYHSVDPETGLHEFSVGPVSDSHAGGWSPDDFRPRFHRFLRVAGGYLELELGGQGDDRRLVIRHLDTTGGLHHQHVLTADAH
ncbi:MAG: hypothetical protein D6753_13075 [Planctomycetota bacterium]|nr:MAG: hypothetical protein D6753_13075 [Planctomycetota bacterium]